MPSKNITELQRQDYYRHEDKARELLLSQTPKDLIDWYHKQDFIDELIAAFLALFLFEQLNETHPEESLVFAELYLKYKRSPNIYKARQIAAVHRQLGHTRRFVEIFDLYLEHKADYKYLKTSRGELELLDHGFPVAKRNSSPQYKVENGRSLYLLHNSLPYKSGGYATRSHGLLSSLVKLGTDCVAVSRLGFPLDEKNPPPSVPPVDTIDDVRYHRLPDNNEGYRDESIVDYLKRYTVALEEIAVKLRPSIIHAASNYMNGVVANFVAAKVGVKSVYEVRGLWEITRISRQPNWEGSDLHQMFVRMETQAAKDADAVIAITQALKSEIVSRGVEADKIIIVPNGVDSSRFTPRPPDTTLKTELGLDGKTVIGFVGSIVDYEGLDDLLQAALRLKQNGRDDFALLLVGDGAARVELIEKSEQLGLKEIVVFPGKVPHAEVERYYSIIDIAPFPRIPIPVCEMVSPLKPFEAMSMGKLVVASSVDALKEIVSDGGNGLLFDKGSLESLVSVLDTALSDETLRRTLGDAARKWVIAERDWCVISKGVSDLYASLRRS